ncbi:hypothetical protein NMG60_11027235 [Bertholletia excelsa]
MCINYTEGINSPPIFFYCKRRGQSKRSKVRVHRLTRRKRTWEENRKLVEEEREMELKNLKLYMENMSILQENEKLRRKASLLHQENLALMSEFQKKVPHFDRLSTTLFLLLHSTTSMK